MEWTYAKAGVDVEKVKSFHEAVWSLLKKTFAFRRGKLGEVCEDILGHYAGVVDIGGGKLLAVHADGVGTKVLIAQMMEKYDTVGIDCVAMNVNDLLCLGVDPAIFVDYIVVEEVRHDMLLEIMKGLVKGAEEAGVAIVGGETAVMPDVVKGVDGRGFDLAGFCVGFVDADRIITGGKAREGDVVIGLKSSGIHSNGLTLARKVLLSKYGVHDIPPELGVELGEELLKPTRIYAKAIRGLLENVEVRAIAHITGGAYSKLERVCRYSGKGMLLDKLPEPHPIFRLIQREGRVSDEEMYRTFNMGVGMCVVVKAEEVEDALDICEKEGYEASVIGRMIREKGVFLEVKGKKLKLA